ncbi:MAG TPA: L,D-transpeptidase family protein, partial [Flavobacterium sp.]|nr:L,D-transpeptidase family protein [Flavobacterium sp.]
PNRFTVYLHDTNHRELFSRSNRSLSSGCIRVEDPLPLAAYLINNEKIDLDSITSVIGSQKTTPHPVRDPIHLYQLYWTAWSDNGKLIFRDDIYQLDAPLYEALRNRR